MKKKRKNVKKDRFQKSKMPIFEGIISLSNVGFGFVAIDSKYLEEKEIFIPVKFVNDALSGDKVKVELLPSRKIDMIENRGPSGKVIEVVERNCSEIVGEVIEKRVLRPINRKMPEIQLAKTMRGAKKGDYVKAKFTKHDEYNNWHGQVTKVLGQAGIISADLDAIIEEFKLSKEYTAKDNAMAMDIIPEEITRVDRRDLRCMTIDPFDAKDFDDALSIEVSKVENCVEVGVHISDAAAYITPKGYFDKQAAKRGFSCYLPGRTLPMLPKELTAKISLQEGAISLAHSVFLTVERNSGKIIDYYRCHTLIEVKKRLNYGEVQKFIDDGFKNAKWSKDIKDDLVELFYITSKMRRYRKMTENFLEIEIPEIRVLCDEKINKITGLSSKITGESESIVEECMLAANSIVGVELEEKRIPGIYRVHPVPEAEKVAEFSNQVNDFFGIISGDITNRKICDNFIKHLEDGPKKIVILGLLLRSLPRAYYKQENDLHFGLGKNRYSHFTSPIRRYSDMAVHQQLWNYDSNKRLRTKKGMEKIAKECSLIEENNDKAYYTASDRLKLRYLDEILNSKEADKKYTAVVTKAFAAGYLIYVQDLGAIGFIPRSRISKKEYLTCGKILTVKLVSIDFSRDSAEFIPCN